MAKDSQYTDAYLGENNRRGKGRGITVGTFLAYSLRGKARSYAGRYASALINSLERRTDVLKGRSILGGVAYYQEK